MLYPQNGGRIVAIDTVTPLRPMYRASNSTGIISGTLRRLYGVRGTNSDDMAPLPLSHVHTVAAGGWVSHRCGFCRGGFNRIIHHHESWIECTSTSRPWPSDTDDDPKLTHACSFLQGASEGKVMRSVVSVYPLLSLYLVWTDWYLTLIFASKQVMKGGSVAEWLACWNQAQKGLGSNRSRDAVG